MYFQPILTLVALTFATPYRGFFESDCTNSCRTRQDSCLNECPVRRNEICLSRCPYRDDDACEAVCPPERDEYCATTCTVKYSDNCSQKCRSELPEPSRSRYGMAGLLIQLPFNYSVYEQNSCAKSCPLRQDESCVRDCRYRDDCSQRCPYEPEPVCLVECSRKLRTDDCSTAGCRDTTCRTRCGRRNRCLGSRC